MTQITLTVNGEQRSVDVAEDMTLLWVLRDVLGLTGTKFGCGEGLCGTCTVHVDGRATRSCLVSASGVVGRQVGEMSGPSIAPAVANAVYAATGRRLRSLPLRLS